MNQRHVDNFVIENLQDLRIFDRTVVNGSMSAAARDLGLSLAVVSKRLAALEARLGLRLEARGEGYAVQQYPTAGSDIDSGQVVRIDFARRN